MACRYPDADDPRQLWQNVMARRQAFRPLPPGRLPVAEYGGRDDADLTYVTRAAVLSDWTFDRQRFRIPGETFRAVDPAHWLALEVSADALADAGFPDGDDLDRSRVGVVLGNSLTGEFSRAATLRTRWPYVRRKLAAALSGSRLSAAEVDEVITEMERRFKAPFPVPGDETLAGALANTIAGRICNHFDFQGTGYTVDGACASSLVAVATAAEAVAAGRLDVALAGGVDLSLDPFELVGFARVGALADSEMRVYDARPTGFLPGEGCGIVILCRADFAERRGLRGYARLIGWATSSDGSGGLTRPERTGQTLALGRAYRHAGIAPSEVDLVEGHGTGTAVGDDTELRTLLAVRGTEGRPATLGSVKANIGHTKAAAGVAGLIKAAMAVYSEVLPPTTGCVQPHPVLTDTPAALRVADEAAAWSTSQRYAGVSAMGFGGINAHLVLAGEGLSTRRQMSRHERRLAARPPRYEVVVCAAARPEELATALTTIRDAARQLSRAELTDLAASLAVGHRGDSPARFATAVATPEELVAAADHALHALAAGRRRIIDRVRRVFLAVGPSLRVGLLFPGQAAPAYRDAGALADLLEELPDGYGDELPIPAVDAADTAAAQPAIVRASLAGLRWLDTLGVRAHGAIGHSLGELTALVWAGALTERDAYGLARARGAAMAAANAAPSGMADIAADLSTVTELVAGTDVVTAADNAERQVVVSGVREEVERVLAAAGRRGTPARWLPVSHAFHSPLMAPAAEPLRAAAMRVDWRPPVRQVISTVTGDLWREEDPVELLVRQLTARVRFREALARLSVDLYVEVGPGHILGGLAGERAVSMDAGSADVTGVAVTTAALFAAGAVASAEPYVSRRFSRPFDPARPRRFLVNPCEVPVEDEPAPAAPVVVRLPAGPDPGDSLAVATARIAAALELDASAVAPTTRLLADLHLSSLRVTQIAGEVTADLGRALPAAPLTLATATVAEFAAALAALPESDADEPAPAVGVAPWVRVFSHHLVQEQAPSVEPVERNWEIVGDLTGHPLAAALRTAFPETPGRPTVRLLALPPGLRDVPCEDVVVALRSCDRDRCPLVVVHHGGVGAAVGRSLAAEDPDVPVLVVEVPADADGVRCAAAEAHRPWAGYSEVVYSSHGVRTVPVAQPSEVAARHDASIPLAAGEVFLVTGGAKGIGAECAAALAAATGAHAVLLGRSPVEDPEVRAVLARIGPTASYHRVDVTDPAAVAAAVAALPGPVRGLLHAAGINRPARIGELTADDLLAALAPKAAGLDAVLDALDLAELRFAVTFGSVIGRTGLPGEACYAIANEWLARRCAELARTAPHVRWLNIEWSVWSGAGMGVRLGVLDSLVRQGLSPVPVDEGVRWLLRLLITPSLPPTVLVAGRLPGMSTLRWNESPVVGARFLEARLSHTPGVEVVTEANVSLGSDPYVDDHRVDGLPVLPAVLGIEAMAQACAALGTKPLPATFRDVTFTRPVTALEQGNRTVRLAALVREDGGVDAVVRSDETGFAVDHFAGAYQAATDDPPTGQPPPAGELIDARPFYGPLFFHGPRFQRVRGFHGLSAYRSDAMIIAEPAARWFGAFHDRHLELGDPGARDAFLHALQACVPDRRVLPVAVGRITVYRCPEGALLLHARQRDEDGERFVFDLTVSDAGRVTEEWHGLVLRAVGPIGWTRWPVTLLGPYLTRSLRRWRPDAPVDLAIGPGSRGDAGRSAALAGWLTGAVAEHAADGRLVVAGTGSVSASHLDGYVLVAAGPGRVAVDWERVGGRCPLDAAAAALAEVIQSTTYTGDRAAAAARAWTCREAAAKLGLPPDAPLTLAETGPDGWLQVACGSYSFSSIVVPTETGRVAACIGLG